MQSSGNKASAHVISENISRILQSGSIAVLATLIEGAPNVGTKLLMLEEPAAQHTKVGSFGIDALDEAVVRHAANFLNGREEIKVFCVKEFAPTLTEWSNAQILFERIQREPRLVICGAGHVGACLAQLASQMGYHPTLIDDRAEFVTRARFPDEQIELVAAANWSEAVCTAVGDGHGVCVAIVTRGHSEDEQCLHAIIMTEADYIGLIGSKRRTNIVLQRLRENGAAEEQLKRVHAPIGLDIGAVTPEEVALAIMAEIVAERRGGKGGSLSKWRRTTGKAEIGKA